MDKVKIELYHCKLQGERISLRPYFNVLSTSERQRAMAYVDQDKRQCFVISRASLRLLLAKKLSCTPQAIQLGVTPRGKPMLIGKHKDLVSFNVSHHNDLILIALTSGAELGIDLAYQRLVIDYLRIAEQFYAEQEVLALNDCHKHEQANLFYRIWVIKEAIVKAMGEGLFYPIRTFNVMPLIDMMDIRQSLVMEVAHKHWYVKQDYLGLDYLYCVVCDYPFAIKGSKIKTYNLELELERY